MSDDKNVKSKKSFLDKAAKNVKTLANMTGDMTKIAKNAGGIYGAAKTALRVAKAVIAHNDKAWYTKYVNVNPAKNTDRDMSPLFNRDITNNPQLGSMPKQAEVILQWSNLHDTDMWANIIDSSYKLLRNSLKSNLPYTQNKLEAYINNALVLAIMCQQFDRDIHWSQFADPTMPEFSEIYTLRAQQWGSAQVVPLKADAMLTGDWADTITSYDKLVAQVSASIRIAPSLSIFLKHYLGNVFITSTNTYNAQYYINRLVTMDWATYDSEKDEVTYAPKTFTTLTVDDMIKEIRQLSRTYGLVIADLIKSQQFVPFYMNKYDDCDYTAVYDETYLQALCNAYTDRSCVTDDGFVRLDEYPGSADDLTTLLFLGGAQDETQTGYIPALRVLSMVVKFDSENGLNWTTQLGNEDAYGTGGSEYHSGPFGVCITTSIVCNIIAQTNVETRGASYVKTAPIIYGHETTTGAATLNTVSSIYRMPITTLISGGRVQAIVSDNDRLVIALSGFNAWSGDFNIAAVCIVYTPGTDSSGNLEWVKPQLAILDGQKLYNNKLEMKMYGYQVISASDVTSYTRSDVTLSNKYTVDQLNAIFAAENTTGFATRYLTFRIRDARVTPKLDLSMTILGAFPQVSSGITYGGTLGGHLPTLLPDSLFLSGTVTYTVTSTSPVMQSTTTIGATQLAAFAVDSLHVCIPVAMSTHVIASKTLNGNTTNNEFTTPIVLLKQEVIPYYYNVKDLKPVLYNMFTSLFVPCDDIYNRLLSTNTMRSFNKKFSGNKERKEEDKK